MKYDFSEKLKFNEDPKLVIKDVELTVNSDAEAVLRLMDVLSTKGEVAGAVEAVKILFNGKDQKKLQSLHLKMKDYLAVIQVAVQLAMGADPAEEESPAGE